MATIDAHRISVRAWLLGREISPEHVDMRLALRLGSAGGQELQSSRPPTQQHTHEGGLARFQDCDDLSLETPNVK